MRIIDISMTISPDMAVYKGRAQKRPQHTIDARIPPDSVNESTLRLSLHTGTHIDSPFHMMEDGWPTEQLPLDKLIVPARVVDLTAVTDGIGKEDLQGLDIRSGEFVLLKTRNSAGDRSSPHFIYLKEDGARYLASLRLPGVGIDALGIERDQPGHPTHLTLMNSGALIVEGLALHDVSPGRYLMVALPLKIRDADGAPARVVLIEGDLAGLMS
jgi:arylformamidase